MKPTTFKWYPKPKSCFGSKVFKLYLTVHAYSDRLFKLQLFDIILCLKSSELEQLKLKIDKSQSQLIKIILTDVSFNTTVQT